MSDNWVTRRTLLSRALNPDDHQAWEEFVKYYKQFIHVVLHQMGIKYSEFEDIVQEVLLKIWKNLKQFKEKPEGVRFRTWLSTVIRNAVIDYIRSKQSYDKRKDKAQELYHSEEFSESDFEKVVSKEWEQHITKTALAKVSENFTGKAIKVFEMTLDEATNDEIAEALDLTTGTVCNLKYRVKKAMIVEIQRLKTELEF